MLALICSQESKMLLFNHFKIRTLTIFRRFKQGIWFRVLQSRRIEKIIIGCGHDIPKGWWATDIVQVPGALKLDVTKHDDWDRYFKPGSLTHILSEHMFEHLDDFQIETALALCMKYLKKDGRLRIAVPDANRKDPAYIEEVAPPADGHLQYFTIDSLEAKLKRAGFSVERLEYYDEDGLFHKKTWNNADGFIKRSFEHDTQKDFFFNGHYYTSIIVDAVK